MSKAKQIVEALTGPELTVLQKYKIADENGEIRKTELRDPKDPDAFRRLPPSPIIKPEVIQRLLSLDKTPDKHILDWIFYVAGGGARAFQASQKSVDVARDWMMRNLMGQPAEGTVDDALRRNPEAFDEFAKQAGYATFEEFRRRGGHFGIGPDDLPIKPMTEEEAEAEWAQDEPVFKEVYFYGDDDVAKDTSKPFAYYQDWPGRDNVYQQIEQALTQYNELVANPGALKLYNKWNKAKGQPAGFNVVFTEPDGTVNFQQPSELVGQVEEIWNVVNAVKQFSEILKDTKKISQYNKLMQGQPFQTDLKNYDTPEELVNQVKNFTRNFAKLKAQANVQFHGKAKAPATGYTKGPNEVIYEDEFMTVVIPATAGASLKKGWVNWCIASKTFWDNYWRSGDPEDLYWSRPGYAYSSAHGVFAFWTFKVPMQTTHPDALGHPVKTYEQLAGWFGLGCREPGRVTISNIHWTDKLNAGEASKQCDIRKVQRELADADPRALESFHKSIEEVKAWILQHTPGKDIEMNPALESLARKLVAMMLGEVRGTDGRPRL